MFIAINPLSTTGNEYLMGDSSITEDIRMAKTFKTVDEGIEYFRHKVLYLPTFREI